MKNLILVRHGQSVWNLSNRFTGWIDVELTEGGIKEAEKVAMEAEKELAHYKTKITDEIDAIIESERRSNEIKQ